MGVTNMPDGKICYVEIPSDDIEASARFYEVVFGWKSRMRGDGQRAFDDTTGGLSGSWVSGRTPLREPGVLVYIMTDSIEESLEKVSSAGGNVATPFTPLGPSGEAYATFTDPAGNLLGMYQQPPKQAV
jgi:predicted enzyme related to lactoylglutathione lyase